MKPFVAVASLVDRRPKWWRHASLRRVARLRDEINADGQAPLLSLTSAGTIVERDSERQPPSADYLLKYGLVRPGNLVVNPMWLGGGGIGVALCSGAVSPEYRVFALGAQLQPRYVHHLLRSQPYLDQYRLLVRAETTFDRRVTKEDFRDLPILLPPIAEQRAIADYLDAETVRIDAMVAKKRRLMELLDERFEAAVFYGVTRGFSGPRRLRQSGLGWVDEIPAEWGTPTISVNFELQLGKMLNAEAASGPNQYPYLRNTNVQWDRFDFDDLASMNFDQADRRRCELRNGDLLVCEGGEVGRAAVWSGELRECYFQKAIHRVRPRGAANSRFLMYCLRAAAKRSVFAVEGNLSTIVHLTGEQLSVYRFPWPPPSEQSTIVDHLDGLSQRAGDTKLVLARQIALLIEHREALIAAAVTGELSISGVAV